MRRVPYEILIKTTNEVESFFISLKSEIKLTNEGNFYCFIEHLHLQ